MFSDILRPLFWLHRFRLICKLSRSQSCRAAFAPRRSCIVSRARLIQILTILCLHNVIFGGAFGGALFRSCLARSSYSNLNDPHPLPPQRFCILYHSTYSNLKRRTAGEIAQPSSVQKLQQKSNLRRPEIKKPPTIIGRPNGSANVI